MNVEILQRMSIEGLRTLAAATAAEIARRVDTSVTPGRTGWFMAKGSKRIVQVTGVNIKTVSVVEMANSASPGTKWRVSPSLLNIDPVIRATPAAVTRPTSSKPATAAAATW